MTTKTHTRTMKAAVYGEYGPPEVLGHKQVAIPDMGEDQIMVDVRAAAINPADRFMVLGRPYAIRLMTGLTAPKRPVPGRALAGVIEAVGENVSDFRVGGKVFGEGEHGAYAEKAVLGPSDISRMPHNVTFEEAATVPLGGVTALQGLRDQGGTKPGDQVLINGATGGIGTFAVQIAKALGAEVTAVCSGESAGMVRSLGADHVIDYTRDDFTRNQGRYDVILDLVGSQSLTSSRKSLTSTGTLVLCAGPPAPSVRLTVAGFIRSPFGNGRITSWVQRNRPADLDHLTGMIEDGTVTPVVDRIFELDQIADAFRFVANGNARGRTIVKMDAGHRG